MMQSSSELYQGRRTLLLTNFMLKPQSKPRTPYQTHQNHTVQLRVRSVGPHRVQVWCDQCDCHVQWLSWHDYRKLQDSQL